MSEKMEQITMEDSDDEGLKAVMGDRFQDRTNGRKEDTRNICVKADASKKPAKAVRTKVFDAKLCFVEKLKDCAKWSVMFGGLCLLVFYWQQTGQMMSSAAVPSMMACTFGAAWCVGRACK